MKAPASAPWRRAALVVAAFLAVATVAGCGGSAKPSGTPTASQSSTTSGSALPHGSGTVRVLYAGSLVNLMEKTVGPAFHQATGYTFQGQGAGSTQLVSEIKGKTTQADVFVSAAPSADTSLEGSANGDWVSWYASFATTSLVLGYNPNGPHAKDFTSKPWYQAITTPGLKLGRTDPKLDPKGALTVKALNQASKTYHDPGLPATVERAAQVFPEEDLVGRLQAGQLDAGFFYTIEASDAKIPTVSLGAAGLKATFTITVLNNAPDQSAADAFVDYLLSPQGRANLTAHGLTVISPTRVSGDTSAIPAALHSVINSG
jgi:molybdate/tungstate transport system substrate-binding protein